MGVGLNCIHSAHDITRPYMGMFALCVCVQVSLANNEGNSPLHFACQYCPAGKTLTLVKLLQHNASVLDKNKAGDTPFDLAVRFNKKGQPLDNT